LAGPHTVGRPIGKKKKGFSVEKRTETTEGKKSELGKDTKQVLGKTSGQDNRGGEKQPRGYLGVFTEFRNPGKRLSWTKSRNIFVVAACRAGFAQGEIKWYLLENAENSFGKGLPKQKSGRG